MVRKGLVLRALGAAAVLQALLGAVRVVKFDAELPGYAAPLLSRASQTGAFSSLLFLAAVLAVAGLGARRSGSGFAARAEGAGLWGVSALAAAGLALTAAGVLTGRFVPGAAWAAVGAAGLLALVPRRGPAEAAPHSGAGRWDAATALFLAALLVPCVFPYVHCDAQFIWGCRAEAVAGTGSLAAMARCTQPAYPPLFSLLLALGGDDPVLGGRTLAWLLVALHAAFLRGAFARLSPRLAAPATLAIVATGFVWITSAMYYANAPLMVFLATGTLLAFGLPPRAPGERDAARGRDAAAALCLAAAVLTRPDGMLYAGAMAGTAALLRIRRRAAPRLVPFLAAPAAWVLWALRPALLRTAGTFFEAASTWRSAGATPLRAAARVLGTFLNVWQSQWLAHYGLGLAPWIVAGAALVLWRRPGPASPAEVSWGLATAAALATVVGTYLAVPFLTNVVDAVQPFPSREFLACWDNFVRSGIGRMTTHLLPVYAAFVLAVVEASAAPGLRGTGASRTPA